MNEWQEALESGKAKPARNSQAVDPTLARDVTARLAEARKSTISPSQVRGLRICNGGKAR